MFGGIEIMVLDLRKNSIGIAILISVIFLTADYAGAAKTVPTIRIEIPKKEPNKTGPTEPTTPAIPLDESDLTPSLDKLNEETFPGDEEEPVIQADEPEERVPPKIFYGDKDLPEQVKALRLKFLDIARLGEVEKLRPLFETFKEPPLLTFEDVEDPIEFLKTSSGDGEGRELLAILLEVLESGYVLRDKDEDGEIYIWPYFVDIPPEDLKPRQLVELFRLITAGDFEDMKAYGAYIFYRVGITPNGELKFFIAGD